MRSRECLIKNKHGVWQVRKKVPKRLEAATATVLGKAKSRVSWPCPIGFAAPHNVRQVKQINKQIAATLLFRRGDVSLVASSISKQQDLRLLVARHRRALSPSDKRGLFPVSSWLALLTICSPRAAMAAKRFSSITGLACWTCAIMAEGGGLLNREGVP